MEPHAGHSTLRPELGAPPRSPMRSSRGSIPSSLPAASPIPSARGSGPLKTPTAIGRGTGEMLREVMHCVDEVMAKIQDLSSSTKSLSSRVTSLEEASEEISGSNRTLDVDSERMAGAIRSIQVRIERVEEAVSLKTDARSMADIEASVVGIEQALTAGRDRVCELERAMQERPSAVAEDVQNLRANVHDLQGHFEQLVALYAKQKNKESVLGDSHQVWETLTEVQSKVKTFELTMQKNLGGNQMPELRSTVAELQSLVASKDSFQETYGKMSTDYVHDIKNDLKRMENQMAALDQAVHDVARKSDSQQLRQTVQDIQMQVGLVEKVAREKVSLSDFQRRDDVVTGLERKVASIDEAWSTRMAQLRQLADDSHTIKNELQMKAGLDDLDEIRCVVTSFQSKLKRLEGRASIEPVSTAPQDLQELQGSVGNLKAQLSSMDNSLRAKADGSEVQSLSATVKAMDTKLVRLENRSHLVEQSPAAAGDSEMARHQETDISELKAHVKLLEEAMAERAGVGDHRQLKSAVSNLQGQLASLTQVSQENAGMDTVQQVKANILSIQAQIHTINQEMHDKAGSEHLQKLKGAFSNMQVHVSNMELAVQEKAGSEQMHQLSAVVAEAKSNLCALEQHKADASVLHQLQDTFAALQLKVPSAERVQQLEGTVTNLSKHVNAMEQGKADKGACPEGFADVHTQVELQHFKGIISGMEKKVTDIEQELQDKVSQGQMQQCRKTIMGVDTKIIGVEQLINEKAGSVQMQQVQTTIQACISNVEQMVHEKIGPDQLQPLKASIASAQAQIASVEQSMHEKVGTSQMQQLKGNLAMVQTKTCGLEQAMQEKAPACQMQQLKESLTGVQAKVSSVVQAVRDQGRSQMQLDDEPRLGELPQRLKRLRALEEGG